MSSRHGFLVVWLALFATCFFYFTAEDDEHVRDRPAATLRSHEGTVLFREPSIAAWVDAVDGQGFPDGAIVATGVSSSATLRLSTGSVLHLAPNSQVELARSEDDDGTRFLVNLLNGNFEIAAAPRDSRKALSGIFSGTEEFDVRNGEQSVRVSGFDKGSFGASRNSNRRAFILGPGVRVRDSSGRSLSYSTKTLLVASESGLTVASESASALPSAVATEAVRAPSSSTVVPAVEPSDPGYVLVSPGPSDFFLIESFGEKDSLTFEFAPPKGSALQPNTDELRLEFALRENAPWNEVVSEAKRLSNGNVSFGVSLKRLRAEFKVSEKEREQKLLVRLRNPNVKAGKFPIGTVKIVPFELLNSMPLEVAYKGFVAGAPAPFLCSERLDSSEKSSGFIAESMSAFSSFVHSVSSLPGCRIAPLRRSVAGRAYFLSREKIVARSGEDLDLSRQNLQQLAPLLGADTVVGVENSRPIKRDELSAIANAPVSSQARGLSLVTKGRAKQIQWKTLKKWPELVELIEGADASLFAGKANVLWTRHNQKSDEKTEALEHFSDTFVLSTVRKVRVAVLERDGVGGLVSDGYAELGWKEIAGIELVEIPQDQISRRLSGIEPLASPTLFFSQIEDITQIDIVLLLEQGSENVLAIKRVASQGIVSRNLTMKREKVSAWVRGQVGPGVRLVERSDDWYLIASDGKGIPVGTYAGLMTGDGKRMAALLECVKPVGSACTFRTIIASNSVRISGASIVRLLN